MRYMRIVAALAAIGFLVLDFEPAAYANPPALVVFDAPDAGTGVVQGTGCFGCTFGINQSGAIVGTYSDANNVLHAFLRHPNGSFATFDAPGADTTANSFHGTRAQSINELGAIAGDYTDVNGVAHGYLRDPFGRFTTFDVPGAVNGTSVIYLSLDGNIAGYALDVDLVFHAYLRRPDGTFAVFAGPNACTTGTSAGCYGSEATYVDFFGIRVGNFMDSSANLVSHGVIRGSFGGRTTFDAPGAGTGFYQGTGCPGCNLGVDLWGTIAGSYTDSNYVFHGFVRSPDGRFTTFEAPGAGSAASEGTGCPSDCPVGLNNFGVITGSYIDANGTQHGYVRSARGTFTTLDPADTIVTQPEAINDAGTIVGYFLDGNLVLHGFIKP
jgi:hypothetical protein